MREGYESLRFNTSIARITELNNAVTQAYPDGGAPRALAESLVLMLAPLAPHIAEELWSRLGHAESLAWTDVPGGRRGAAGRRHGRDSGAGQRQSALGDLGGRATPTPADVAGRGARRTRRWRRRSDGRPVKRVVAVPGRLINFVV